MPDIKFRTGDCRARMAEMDPESVDSIVTDPPYGLSFMGKGWDRGVPGVEFWEQAYRVLKPGGYLLAFGGSRTYHRLAVAIEDAGFEIRDCLSWLYGSGFPKSLDVSKAIDKSLGATGGQGPLKRGGERLMNQAPDGKRDGEGVWNDEAGRDPYTYLPGSPEAERWQGWGTALKPAWEPVIMARKPFPVTVAENVLTHGTGALNIDECRVGVPDGFGGGSRGSGGFASGYEGDGFVASNQARWPANVLMTHHDDCVERTIQESPSLIDILEEVEPTDVEITWVCVRDCPVRILDQQAGTLAGGAYPTQRGNGVSTSFGQGRPSAGGPRSMGDTGGASRFLYCSKPSRHEREAGLEGEIAPAQRDDTRQEGNSGGDNPRNRGVQERLNSHPTVKPIAVMEWLVKMVTPPEGVVLDPFMGSGTTGVACARLRFSFIGIDISPEYVEIAKHRIKYQLTGGKILEGLSE